MRGVLIEADSYYPFRARLRRIPQIRQEGQPKPTRDIAWRVQLPLAQRYRRLNSRKLHVNEIRVALDRELAGFLPAIARNVKVADLISG
jgi:hypothetical protein